MNAISSLTHGRRKFTLDDMYVPEPNSGCWLWTGSISCYGYGVLTFGSPPIRQSLRAHRWSWELLRGPIPAGLLVLHKCDVRCCVNPDHLYIGDSTDNNRDTHRRGRAPDQAGQNNNQSKLNEAQIIAIREDPRTQDAIAAAYGVSQGQIWRIKRRIDWRHVP